MNDDNKNVLEDEQKNAELVVWDIEVEEYCVDSGQDDADVVFYRSSSSCSCTC